MTLPSLKLSAFERALFRTAIALAALLILVRVGAMLLLAFLPHVR